MAGRPRLQIDLAIAAQMEAMAAAGASPAKIARATGLAIGTVKRRVAELRDGISASRAAATALRQSSPVLPSAPPAGDSDDGSVVLPDGAPVVPPDASLDEIEHWLSEAKAAATLAKDRGETDNYQRWMRLVHVFIEARRKAMPPPKIDINDRPDMIEAAKMVRKRWFDLADNLMRVASSSLAETIGRMLREREGQ